MTALENQVLTVLPTPAHLPLQVRQLREELRASREAQEIQLANISRQVMVFRLLNTIHAELCGNYGFDARCTLYF